MKKLIVNFSDCSYKKLVRIAEKSGFIIFEGRKHCKVKTRDNQFIAMIPRHNKLDKHTAKGIVEVFNKFGASIEHC